MAWIGEEARRSLAHHHPDVALVDIGLPGLTGYELVKQLREDPAYKHPTYNDVYVIAVTGRNTEPERRRGLEAGFDAYLPKPIAIEPLKRLLATRYVT